MNLSPRALFAAAPALVVVAGSFLLSRAYLQDADRATPEGNSARLESVFPTTLEDADRLHRVALKQEAVDDLLDGRITLEEAARRFESLSDCTFERAVNQVLVFARVGASHDLSGFREPLARIESEASSLVAERSVRQ